MSNSRILAAETVGTAVLVMCGPGSAILALNAIGGALGVALAFGFSLMVMAYTVGNISGCHINPAVTFGLWLAKKVEGPKVPFYLIGQFLGAAIGSTVIFGIANGKDDFEAFGNFAQNGWGKWSPGGYGLGATAIVEVVFTALLVLVVLSTTHRKFSAAASGITVGFTLTLIHLVTIPVDSTSVNPARSFGTAIYSDPDAWVQLWAFIVFPLIGAALGVFIWLMVDDSRLEQTHLFNPQLAQARDIASNAVGGVVDELGDAAEDVHEKLDRPAGT
jgi:aquaporin Z